MENKKDYFKNWRKEHKDSIKESNRRWHEKNREKHNKMMKERQDGLKSPKVYIHYMDYNLNGKTIKLWYIGQTLFPIRDRWLRSYGDSKFAKFIQENGGYERMWNLMNHEVLEEYDKYTTTKEMLEYERRAIRIFGELWGWVGNMNIYR